MSVDADPSLYTGVDGLIASSVHRLIQSGDLQNIDFTFDFEGMTYGTGMTLAGGYKTGLRYWTPTTRKRISIFWMAKFRR